MQNLNPTDAKPSGSTDLPPKHILSDTNALLWRKERNDECIVKYGLAGRSFRNNNPPVVVHSPTSLDQDSDGQPTYDTEESGNRLSDRGHSDLKAAVVVWRAADLKATANDSLLLERLFATISAESLRLIQKDPGYEAFAALPDGNRVTPFMSIVNNVHTSPDGLTVWKRTSSFFTAGVALDGPNSLHTELERIALGKDQLSMDLEDPLHPGFIKTSKLHSIAILNLLQNELLAPFRTHLLTTSSTSTIFDDPSLLSQHLTTWYKSNSTFLNLPPSSQSYMTTPTPPANSFVNTPLPNTTKKDKSYCPLCFLRCGKQFPHTKEKCKSSLGTRLPTPPPTQSISQAGRAYLAAYQVDPSSDTSINALLSLSEHLN
jgi:hypothetical protein